MMLNSSLLEEAIDLLEQTTRNHYDYRIYVWASRKCKTISSKAFKFKRFKRKIKRLDKDKIMNDINPLFNTPSGEELVQFYKNERQEELKAISLSWFGYHTTKELPPNAYVIWQKLSAASQSTFRRLADKKLGA